VTLLAKRTAKTPASSPIGQVAISHLDHRRVERLAYSYWEARGCPDGSPEEDWFRAEDELRRQKAEWAITKKRAKPRQGDRAGRRQELN